MVEKLRNIYFFLMIFEINERMDTRRTFSDHCGHYAILPMAPPAEYLAIYAAYYCVSRNVNEL